MGRGRHGLVLLEPRGVVVSLVLLEPRGAVVLEGALDESALNAVGR